MTNRTVISWLGRILGAMNKALLIVLLLLLPTAVANACIWDRDTLAMERARFPEVNELIVGYFPRHSSAYYQWRLEQVIAIPIEQRTAADYDDLGASYDKLGEHDKAIQTMLDKIEKFPDEGLYETHANLGTFYIHNGDLEQAVQYIGSAIEINPDAHFGREVYQKLLVEYVIQQRAAGNTLPLHQDNVHPFASASAGFGSYVIQARGDVSKQEQLKDAIKGILGMMRFGNYDSPVLLEALGDLLTMQFENESGVQRLAARAYLKASYEVEDKFAIDAYRAKAQSALGMQEGVKLRDIESNLKKEIADGVAFFVQVEADEQAWAATGEDVDAKFEAKYYKSPVIKASLTDRIAHKARFQPLHLIVVALLIGVGLASALAVIFRARRRQVGARVSA